MIRAKFLIHSVLSIMTLLVAFFFISCAETPPPTTYEATLGQARAEGKNLLIYFTGKELCPACIILDRNAIETPGFQDYLKNHFIYLEVDCRGLLGGKINASAQALADHLQDHFGVEKIPTLLAVNPDGTELARIGLLPPQTNAQDLIGRLNDAIKK